jgi:hypothetical protein
MERATNDDYRPEETATETSPLIQKAKANAGLAVTPGAEEPLVDPEAGSDSEEDDEFDKPKITGVRIELIIPAMAIGVRHSFAEEMEGTWAYDGGRYSLRQWIIPSLYRRTAQSEPNLTRSTRRLGLRLRIF